jgi:hypothetical protein
MGINPDPACTHCHNCVRKPDTLLRAPINLVAWQIYKVLYHLAQKGVHQTVKQLVSHIRRLNNLKSEEPELLFDLDRGLLGAGLVHPSLLAAHVSLFVLHSSLPAEQCIFRDWKSS